jgi:hypothetical protein
MNGELIERAKTFWFIALWFQWNELYLSKLSVRDNIPYGYRAGVFWPHGARDGQHHDDWPAFFQGLAAQGLAYTSIHALWCYQRFPSCKIFVDGGPLVFP